MTDQLTFIINPGNDLSTQVKADIVGLCSRAYEMKFEPMLKTFSDPTHVLAYSDDKLVSHALWVTRWLQSEPFPFLRTAFVEAVATDPLYQGRGFGTALMRVLGEAIADFDLGALSPAELGLYSRTGWELWRGPLFIRTQQGLLPTPDDRVMILRLPKTPALDLEAPLSAEWREGELW